MLSPLAAGIDVISEAMTSGSCGVTKIKAGSLEHHGAFYSSGRDSAFSDSDSALDLFHTHKLPNMLQYFSLIKYGHTGVFILLHHTVYLEVIYK